MTQTPARRRFKGLAGHVNHFLITILIGLDAVRAGEAQRSPTFSTSWEPHDVVRSADRSAEFALKALMSWLIDTIDAYASALNRKPFLIQSVDRRNRLDACGRSVMAKTRWLADTFDASSTVEFGLTVLGITWRNRLVHSDADNDLPSDVRDLLVDRAGVICDRYQGLDIDLMLGDLSGSTAPKFKEATALVRAVQGFVEEIDRQVLAALELGMYVEQELEVYVGQDDRRRIANIWGKDPERTLSSIRQLAFQAGIGEVDEARQPVLRDQDLADLARLTPKEARERLVTRRA